MWRVAGLLVLGWFLRAQTELPDTARAHLDRRYPGWRLAPVAPQVADWFRDARFAFQPNRIEADFDGDGHADYAVALVLHGRQRVVALLRRGTAFVEHRLADDAPDPFTYLLLYRRGSKDFDFETLKPFRYATDSIGVMYFNRTPLTFTYRGTRFEKPLAKSDEEI